MFDHKAKLSGSVYIPYDFGSDDFNEFIEQKFTATRGALDGLAIVVDFKNHAVFVVASPGQNTPCKLSTE